MAGTLTLRVITPDKIALDQPVEFVVLPGVDGELGVLPRHAAMVAALDIGVLRWRVAGKQEAMYISGGFAEVGGDTVRVVTPAAERPGDIDEARARDSEKRARERIALGKASPSEAVDLLRAEAALRRSLMRLRAREFRGG